MVKKDKWFSWGWLIFWAIVSPGIALLYFVYKLCKKHYNDK